MGDYMVEESSGPLAIRYRRTVVAIHWLSALLIVIQMVVGFLFSDMPRGPERMEMFDWHKTLGVALLLLAVARLGVRLMNPPPPYPQDFPKLERALAVWSHRLLYVAIIGLPLTGLAAVSGRAEGGMVDLLWGMQFPAIPGVPKENPFGDLHEWLVYGALALFAIHVLAALKNQFVTGGPVAGRMPPFVETRRDVTEF